MLLRSHTSLAPALTASRTCHHRSCRRLGSGQPALRDVGPGSAISDNTTPAPGLNSTNASAAWCAAVAPPPLQALGPHVTPLGLVVYPDTLTVPGAFPAPLAGGVFVAEHGGANGQQEIGFRIAHVALEGGATPVNHTVFASGWLLPNNTAWGQPAGLLVLPDGSLLVSDDLANDGGAVYRISYAAAAAESPPLLLSPSPAPAPSPLPPSPPAVVPTPSSPPQPPAPRPDGSSSPSPDASGGRQGGSPSPSPQPQAATKNKHCISVFYSLPM